jgi:hypothetical protein
LEEATDLSQDGLQIELIQLDGLLLLRAYRLLHADTTKFHCFTVFKVHCLAVQIRSLTTVNDASNNSRNKHVTSIANQIHCKLKHSNTASFHIFPTISALSACSHTALFNVPC